MNLGAEQGPPPLVLSRPRAARDGPGLELPCGPAPGHAQAQEREST